MNPAYKDLVERTLHDRHGVLWDCLCLEAVYANYQDVLKQEAEAGKDVSALKTIANDLKDEHLPLRIVKTVPHLNGALFDAIDTARILRLISAELEGNKG